MTQFWMNGTSSIFIDDRIYHKIGDKLIIFSRTKMYERYFMRQQKRSQSVFERFGSWYVYIDTVDPLSFSVVGELETDFKTSWNKYISHFQ